MPIEDFFGQMLDEGARGKGWRSFWALFGLGLGVLVGGYIGYQTGIVAAISGVAIGGVVGWLLGIALKGLFRILGLILVFGVIIIGWYWLTGQFG